MNGKCLYCKEAVAIGKTAKEGDLIICRACDTELEIVSLEPLELDWPLDDLEDGDYQYAYDYEEEDWEDD